MTIGTSRRLGRATAGIATAVALTALVAAAPAEDDLADGGRWFYTKTSMAELQQQATGSGVRVAMIDGLINPQAPDLAASTLSVVEPAFCAETLGGPPVPAASTSPAARHATSMASIVVGTGAGINGEEGVKGLAPGAELVAYAGRIEDAKCETVGTSYRTPGRDDYTFGQVVADGADIIFVPGGVRVNSDDLATALKAGTIVIGAAGNDGGEVLSRPASMNGVVAVAALGPDGQRDPRSSSGPRISIVAPGLDFLGINETFTRYGTTNGSSNAAAYTAGALALVWSAHPEATGNQILQAMIRTTGGSEHEPARVDDQWGFGILNARQMMSVDPTLLPDENPFLSDDASAEPTMDQILGTDEIATEAPPAATNDPTNGPRTAPKPDGEAGTSAMPAMWLLLTVAAAVLVAIAAATWAILARRRTRMTSDRGGHHG